MATSNIDFRVQQLDDSERICAACHSEKKFVDDAFACDRCHLSPLCLSCVLKEHDDCDCYNVRDEIESFLETVDIWRNEKGDTIIDDLIAKRNHLQNVIEEIMNLSAHSHWAENIERLYLSKAQSLCKRYELLPDLLSQFISVLDSLHMYALRNITYRAAVERLDECKDIYKELTTIIQDLDDSEFFEKLDEVRSFFSQLSPPGNY